jgi:hypothetical protein
VRFIDPPRCGFAAPELAPPRCGFAASPQGGAAGGPAEPDPRRLLGFGRACAAAALLLLAACESGKPPPPTTTPPVTVNRPAQTAPPIGRLPAPDTPRSLAQLRLQAAQRLMAANPDMTYNGVPPQPLLAIPVLEIELNADGSIRNIDVMRKPSQAFETTQMAIDAVRRAAPFGDVSRLPRPWKFTETFLFRDDRRFKPRTLDS